MMRVAFISLFFVMPSRIIIIKIWKSEKSLFLMRFQFYSTLIYPHIYDEDDGLNYISMTDHKSISIVSIFPIHIIDVICEVKREERIEYIDATTPHRHISTVQSSEYLFYNDNVFDDRTCAGQFNTIRDSNMKMLYSKLKA